MDRQIPESGMIDLWKIELGNIAVGGDGDCLTAPERLRAERYLRSGDGALYLAGRVALRSILARYLGEAPGALPLVAGDHGKPGLGPPLAGRLSFNVSRTKGPGPARALLAVCADGAIGVDLEPVARPIEIDLIATDHFAPGEQKLLKATESYPIETFFTLWTLKEAILKALGLGLGSSLAAFEFALDPHLRLVAAPAPVQASDWYFEALTPWPGFKAAIARDRPISHVRWRAFP